MEDVTWIMNHYRECVRHIWNTGFLGMDDTQDIWQLQEVFEQVAGQLFSSLVLGSLGSPNVYLPMRLDRTSDPLRYLHIVPTAEVPIMINRSDPPGGYWDDPVNRVQPEETDMMFHYYYDFDLIGYRDFEYYAVRITAFKDHPQLVGREALISTHSAKVLLDENAW
jgi:hypothetical protein